MKIRPLSDWVVLKPGEEEAMSAGGIIIPDMAKEKPMWGVVVSAGPGRFKTEKEKGGRGKKEEKRFVPTEVKPGDKVLYEKYMARDLELEGEKITMVREEYILGMLGGADKTALEKKGTTAVEKSKKGSSPVVKSTKGTSAIEKSKKTAPKTKNKK